MHLTRILTLQTAEQLKHFLDYDQYFLSRTVQAIVKANGNSQVMGNGNFNPSHSSLTHEWILMTLRICNHLMSMTPMQIKVELWQHG